jgi:hypothetical protein
MLPRRIGEQFHIEIATAEASGSDNRADRECARPSKAVLAELIRAVTEAQRVAWRLGVAEGDCNHARELYGRLEAVRDELESLRLGEWVAVRKEIDPIWLENLFEGFLSRPEGSNALG